MNYPSWSMKNTESLTLTVIEPGNTGISFYGQDINYWAVRFLDVKSKKLLKITKKIDKCTMCFESARSFFTRRN